ncbi:MAG: hypothetical protein WCB46_12695 [Methanoregula sp.]
MCRHSGSLYISKTAYSMDPQATSRLRARAISGTGRAKIRTASKSTKSPNVTAVPPP